MAVRPPALGSRFIVDLGNGTRTGFAAVHFPPFTLVPDPAAPPLLRLTRAATGALDLYDWWDGTRREAKDTLRTVTVDLLDSALRRRVLRWRFLKARPVSLDYGALDANQAAIVSETLVLTFERVEMREARKPPSLPR